MGRTLSRQYLYGKILLSLTYTGPMPGRQDATRDELLDAWAHLLEAHAHLERVLGSRVDEATGITMPVAEVLLRLLQNPEHALPTTRLAHDVSFTSGGFTRFVDRLVREGLVERRPSPTDRRVIHVALTEHGVTVARKTADALVEGLRDHALEPLGRHEFVALSVLLRRLQAGLPS